MTLDTRTSIPEDVAREGVLATAITRAMAAARSAVRLVARLTYGVRSVVTPVGRGVALGAVAALAAGIVWGWAELVIVGVGLVVLVGLASLWLLGGAGGGFRLALTSPRVTVGEPAEARLTPLRSRWRRQGAVQVELPVGDLVLTRSVPGVASGGGAEERFEIPTRRRGVVMVGPARSVRADPLGLLRRVLVYSDVAELRVHPRTIPVDAIGTGVMRDLEGVPTRDLTASDIAFHALREYQPGDDRRHIHWRSSAKTGIFMVRQFEETRRSRLMVVLDLDPRAYADDDEFELAVSAAASIGTRAVLDARSIAFAVSGRTAQGRRGAAHELPTVSRDRLLDALCTVRRDEQAPPLSEVTIAAAETMPGVSLAFLVTGSALGTQSLRHAARRLPVGVQAVGVRCTSQGEALARTAAGLTVLDVGYLDDLRSLLARTASAA